jgi:putative addiction module CopG family antidote
MNWSLKPEIRKSIERKVRSGAYKSADDVVLAGLAALEQQEQFGSFAAGELDELIAPGEQSIKGSKGIPASKVFKELRERSRQRRNTGRRKSA